MKSICQTSCRSVKTNNRYVGLPDCSNKTSPRMLLFVGFFHCKSQKVKGAYSLILREKIKGLTRKLDIASSRY